jgi:hypothetical protein
MCRIAARKNACYKFRRNITTLSDFIVGKPITRQYNVVAEAAALHPSDDP